MDPEVPMSILQEFASQMRNLVEQVESLKTSILERLDAKIDAKFEKFYRQNKNPIQLGKVDEGNFNFPISSLPRGEGVGELKFPKSLPDVAPILEAVSYLPTFPVIGEPVEPKDLIPVAIPLKIPSSECFSVREEANFPTLFFMLEEKVEKNVFYQSQVELLYPFYEFDIRKSMFLFSYLEDLLYDLYEFNISKFLSFGEKGVM
jgi:hypothetical protein